MNIPAAPGDRVPSPAPHPARELSARLDGLLAALLLWADRLGILRPLVARQVTIMAGMLRALSALFTRLADGGFAVAPAPDTAARRPALPAPTPSTLPPAPARNRAAPHSRARAPAADLPAAHLPAALVPAERRRTPAPHPRARRSPASPPLPRADRARTRTAAIFVPLAALSPHVHFVTLSYQSSPAFPRRPAAPTFRP